MQKPRSLPANFHAQEYGGIEPPHDVLLAPARSILPFLRYPLGYRTVHPSQMLALTVFMIVAPPIAWALYGTLLAGTGRHIPADTGQLYLVGFALLSFVASAVVFVRRWVGQRRGEPIHTLECGHSWLAYYTTLPPALCEMLIVPLAVGALGWLIDDTLSINLGRWLILSACSLFGLAFWEYRRDWSQHRAAIDEAARAKAYEARFTRHEQAQPKDGPVIAELGKELRNASVRQTAASDEQRSDIGAGGRGRHPRAQHGHKPIF